MSISNKYIKRSRILEAKFREFRKCFVLDLVAYKITLLTGPNRNTVNRYLLLISARIAEYFEQSSPFQREIEIDEPYFGARRIKRKRGPGAYSKNPVFGILSKERVYAEIVPDCTKQTLQGIIRGKVDLESVIHSESIIVSAMETTSSPMGKDTSTALYLSDHMPKGGS